jgi:hypothetical protein
MFEEGFFGIERALLDGDTAGMAGDAGHAKQLAFRSDSGVCGRDNDSDPLSVSQGIGHATHSQIKAGFGLALSYELHGCFRAHKHLISPPEGIRQAREKVV